MLRRIFGPKKKEVAGGWRRLHNEELHNFYTSPNIIRVSRRTGWAGNVARMLEWEICTKFCSENLKGRDHSEVLGVDVRIILAYVLEKEGGKLLTGFIWLRIGTSGGLL
jgi:hypothetical protein